ncbi:hypothetical protein N7540_012921 [Penicillium herquei]|nr:hypothetical protein N7540_012921 [Penicillium herquei]
MAWRKSTLLLLLTSIEYTLGFKGYRHAHGHLMPHAESLEPRDIAWADRIPADMLIEFRTLTTTVYQDCRPTNTIFVTTTVIEDILLEPTHSHPEPTNFAIHQPLVAESEATTTIHMTKTVMDIMREDLHTTTTIVRSISGYGNTTVTVGLDINTPSRVASEKTLSETYFSPKITNSILGTKNEASGVISEDKEPLREAFVDEKENAIPTPTDPAPGILPKLPGLPQLLPVTAVPDLSQLTNALDPYGQPLPSNIEWTSIPKDGKFSTKGFGGRTAPQGTNVKYRGNIGIPWGSNIKPVSPFTAHEYKYVVKFQGTNTEPWTVNVWNKVGPDGKMDGWYGNSALTFVLAPGETRYVAFDEDSEGAWGAAPGTKGLPIDPWGGYTSTWGEFTFGDVENNGWSGWDVSAIQTQIAHDNVQGMRICQADGKGCSIITPGAKKVVNAYTESMKHHDGIGGAAAPGPVRLVVDLDYQG